MKTEVIQFVGVNKLEALEQDVVNKLTTEYYEKLKRSLNNLTSLIVHVKTYDVEGSKKKFSIHTRVTAPGQNFESTKAQDWDLARTLHKSFQDLENQIRHHMHSDDQKTKYYAK